MMVEFVAEDFICYNRANFPGIRSPFGGCDSGWTQTTELFLLLKNDDSAMRPIRRSAIGTGGK